MHMKKSGHNKTNPACMKARVGLWGRYSANRPGRRRRWVRFRTRSTSGLGEPGFTAGLTATTQTNRLFSKNSLIHLVSLFNWSPGRMIPPCLPHHDFSSILENYTQNKLRPWRRRRYCCGEAFWTLFPGGSIVWSTVKTLFSRCNFKELSHFRLAA